MLARATQAWCARRRQWAPVEAAVCCLVRRKKFRLGDAVEAVRGDLLDVEVLAVGERGVPPHLGRSAAQATDTPLPAAAAC
jgi:hypothetical protein